MLKKYLRGWLSAKQAETTARFHEIVNAIDSLSPEYVQDLPPQDSVLVFAPHCDDEALGCGGTLYKHHLSGHHITTVFLTDGSQSLTDIPRKELVQTRQEEGRKAARILGINRCIFLNYEDRRLKETEKTVRKITSIIEEIKPDTLYIPFYLDNHPDHRATAKICLKALQNHPVMYSFFYEIWTTLIPNYVVDITPMIGKKLEAIRIYKSQNNIEALADQVASLNRYRSINTQDQSKFVEAFLKFDGNLTKRFLSS